MIIQNEFTLQDVNIIPLKISNIRSRKEVNVYYKYNKLPILSSPMAYFTHLNLLYLNPEDRFFVYTLPRISPNKNVILKQLEKIKNEYKNDRLDTISEFLKFLKFLINKRFVNATNEEDFFKNYIEEINYLYLHHLNYFDVNVRFNAAKELRKNNIPFIPSVGINELDSKDEEKKKKIIELIIHSNTDMYLIDTANGYMKYILDVIKYVKKYSNKTAIFGNIISGNILYDYRFEGINKIGVRIGIGNGSQCLTSINTGIGRPQFSALYDVYTVAKEIFSNKENIILINDGGVRRYSDIAVALLFSDYVMTNYLFKSTELNIHRLFSLDNEKVISYGMASKYAKILNDGYIEGDITYSNRKSIKDIKSTLITSLQSTLSYIGCKNIEEYDYKMLEDKIALSVNSNPSMKDQINLK